MLRPLAIETLTFLCVLTANCSPLAAQDGIAFFEQKVRPVLVDYCYECHSDQDNVQGGLVLDSRAGIAAGGDSGPVLVKGNPEASLLIEAVRYENRDLQMPPTNKLSAQAIKDLEAWVEMGAPDPREDPLQGERLAGLSIEEGRQFWSMVPIQKPSIPAVGISSFVRNPIDAFVLQKLRSEGLSPAPPASKQVLIRRLTQDLIGLPPKPHEVKGFLHDDSPDAYERAIERLLHSPDYGIHWGRHWLDVARYADSNGLDENIGFGNAWRYRDYVIEAFNQEKPYDQFVEEQLAGDLVPGASPETIVATCFLQLGPKVMAEPDIEKLHLDVIDEQLDTIGKAFLGLTLGCARCHDHKFDPIKQEDYYALAAILKGTKTFGEKRNGAIKFWYEHSLATEEELEELKQIEQELKAKTSAASTFKNKQYARLRSEARERAVDYLVACTEFETGSTLDSVSRIANKHGLHARVLYHCRSHLEFHRDESLFEPWHCLMECECTTDLREHYSQLFQAAQDAWTNALKEDSKTKQLVDPVLEEARVALLDNAGFLAIPSVVSSAFDEETLAE